MVKNFLIQLIHYCVSRWIYSVVLSYEVVGIMLYIFSDGDIDICIPCLWTTIFDVHCPGCGLTTATMSMLRLDFPGAWEANPLAFVVVPGLIFYATMDFMQFRKRYQMNAKLA